MPGGRTALAGLGAMNELVVTYAGTDYLDRMRPLVDGTVRPAGIALRWIVFRTDEGGKLFERVARHVEFDATEMSTSTYMNFVARGDRRYIAIPVFPSRCFRHNGLF